MQIYHYLITPQSKITMFMYFCIDLQNDNVIILGVIEMKMLILLVLLTGCQGTRVDVEVKTLLWEVRTSLHNGETIHDETTNKGN